VFECLKRNLYVVGVDINKNETDELKKKNLKGAKIICGDILKVELEKEFDGAICLDFCACLAKRIGNCV